MDINEQKPLTEKSLFRIGIISYLILFILAIVFFKERTILLDSSFRFFYMLKDGNYVLQVNRFGSVFSQSFIYFSYHLGLPLKYIMINYSVGFIILNALVFFISLKWLKNSGLALTLLLSNVFMVACTFYWIQSELIEGITFTLLYFGVLQHFAGKDTKVLRLIILSVMLVTLVFFHPLMIIIFLFISIFSILSTIDKKHLKYLYSGIPLAFIILLFKTFALKTKYDTAASGRIVNLLEYFPNYHKLESNGIFWNYVMHDYYFLPILLVTVTLYYLINKLWLKAGLVSAFFWGYLLILITSFPTSTDQWHLESFYMPLGIFLLLPFVTDILPRIKKSYGLALIVLITGARLVHIEHKHEKFTAALNWKRELLAKTADLENRKLLIDAKQVPEGMFEQTWSSPYEFWMLSTLEFDEQRTVLIYNTRHEVRQWDRYKYKTRFLTKWGSLGYDELQSHYLKFTDSTTHYVFYDLPRSVPE